MKRIGDVMKTLSIPISTRPVATSTPVDAVKCPICKDAGYLRYDVPVGHPHFGRIYQCECKTLAEQARHAEQLRRLSNLGEQLANYTFQTFDRTVEGVEEAYRAAITFARDPEGWLFLHGKCGTGKTHLAVAIALHAMERQNWSVLFNVVPDLLDHLRATFDPSSGVAYDELFNKIRDAQLLVLDDLGTENATPWAREKLYQIFNYRYNERLPTVITSNLDFKSDPKRIEERVLSRLLDTRNTRYVMMDAEDYRRRRAVPTGANGRR